MRRLVAAALLVTAIVLTGSPAGAQEVHDAEDLVALFDPMANRARASQTSCRAFSTSPSV